MAEVERISDQGSNSSSVVVNDRVACRYIYAPAECEDAFCISCTPRFVYLYNIFRSRSVECPDHQAMWTDIGQLHSVTDCSVIERSLAVTVVKMSPQRESDPRIVNNRLKVAVADNTGTMNAYIWRRPTVLFKVGQSIILTKYVVRQGAIQVTERTIITRRNVMTISDDRITEAKQKFVAPRQPLTPLTDLDGSRGEYKVSVEGTVTDAGHISVYQDRFAEYRYKRFVRIQRGRTYTLILLHSAAAAHCSIELGDELTALDVRAMNSPLIMDVAIVALYEDQILVRGGAVSEEAVVVLSFQSTNVYHIIWITLQAITGVRKVFGTLETLCTALPIAWGYSDTLPDYLPIDAVVGLRGNYLQTIEVVRHRQVNSAPPDSTTDSPISIDFPVTVAEPIENRFTVEANISQEEGYYLSDISETD